MKVSLLGGSNSLYGCGIKTGISSIRQVELSNYSLGATSSLQNLASLIEFEDEIESTDLIITESNVNDTFNLSYLNLDVEVVKRNIDLYYEYLASKKKVVCVLLLPLNEDRPGIIENSSQIKDIYLCHKNCIDKYNFFFVDLVSEFEGIPREKLDLLMPDCRHVKPLFIHELLKNVTSFFFRHIGNINVERVVSDLRICSYLLSAEEFSKHNGVPLIKKENSYFSSDTAVLPVDVGRRFSFPNKYSGYKLIGVGTWGEEESKKLCFNFADKRVVKSFSELKSFNELVSEGDILDDFYMEYSDSQKSEPTILEGKKVIFDQPASILSFIFIGSDKVKYEYCLWSGVKDLVRLIPNASFYIFDSNYCKKHISDKESSISSLSEVKSIMGIAVELSRKDPELAFELAKKVYKYVSRDPCMQNDMNLIKRALVK